MAGRLPLSSERCAGGAENRLPGRQPVRHTAGPGARARLSARSRTSIISYISYRVSAPRLPSRGWPDGCRADGKRVDGATPALRQPKSLSSRAPSVHPRRNDPRRGPIGRSDRGTDGEGTAQNVAGCGP